MCTKETDKINIGKKYVVGQLANRLRCVAHCKRRSSYFRRYQLVRAPLVCYRRSLLQCALCIHGSSSKLEQLNMYLNSYYFDYDLSPKDQKQIIATVFSLRSNVEYSFFYFANLQSVLTYS